MKLFILLCLCLVATMASAQNATIAATTTTGGLADVAKTVTGVTGAVVRLFRCLCTT
jgi:ABC-type Zn uptake system ZnuABC Zn-binding protein ZnuA